MDIMMNDKICMKDTRNYFISNIFQTRILHLSLDNTNHLPRKDMLIIVILQLLIQSVYEQLFQTIILEAFKTKLVHQSDRVLASAATLRNPINVRRRMWCKHLSPWGMETHYWYQLICEWMLLIRFGSEYYYLVIMLFLQIELNQISWSRFLFFVQQSI